MSFFCIQNPDREIPWCLEINYVKTVKDLYPLSSGEYDPDKSLFLINRWDEEKGGMYTDVFEATTFNGAHLTTSDVARLTNGTAPYTWKKTDLTGYKFDFDGKAYKIYTADPCSVKGFEFQTVEDVLYGIPLTLGNDCSVEEASLTYFGDVNSARLYLNALNQIVDGALSYYFNIKIGRFLDNIIYNIFPKKEQTTDLLKAAFMFVRIVEERYYNFKCKLDPPDFATEEEQKLLMDVLSKLGQTNESPTLLSNNAIFEKHPTALALYGCTENGDNGDIVIGEKFRRDSEEAQRVILAHEIGHMIYARYFGCHKIGEVAKWLFWDIHDVMVARFSNKLQLTGDAFWIISHMSVSLTEGDAGGQGLGGAAEEILADMIALEYCYSDEKNSSEATIRGGLESIEGTLEGIQEFEGAHYYTVFTIGELIRKVLSNPIFSPNTKQIFCEALKKKIDPDILTEVEAHLNSLPAKAAAAAAGVDISTCF